MRKTTFYVVEVEHGTRMTPDAFFDTAEEAIEFAKTVNAEALIVSKVEMTTLWSKG